MIQYEQRCGETSTVEDAVCLPGGLAVHPGLVAPETPMHARRDGTMSFGGTLPCLSAPIFPSMGIWGVPRPLSLTPIPAGECRQRWNNARSWNGPSRCW